MKKIIASLTIIAVMCSTANFYASPVKALEAVSIEDYNQQTTTDTPDLDAAHTSVSENGFEFYVYEDFAYLSGCEDSTITEAVIPDEVEGVPVIGITNSPFGLCRNLTTIVLPDTLQYLSWVDLVIPVTRVGSDEEPQPSVSKVEVSENNPYYTTYNGLLYSKDMKTLIGCPPAMGLKEVNISEQTDTIGDYAFAACAGLETAIVPEHIEHICNGAFVACSDLVKAELPESITFISGDMFWLCESLVEITFKGTIEKIGYGAFGECTSLKDFTLPETVTFIGSSAFENSGCVEYENGVHYVQNWIVGSDEDVVNAILREDTIGIAEMSLFSRQNLELLDIPESAKYIDQIFLGITGSTPLRINYRSSFIGEKTLVTAKTTTDLYIYDPECEIFDSEKTIPAEYQFYAGATDNNGIILNSTVTGAVVIHGYADSTAQAYAEKYGRQFVLIEEEITSGDANGDGTLNVADAVLLQKWLLSVPDTKLDNWQAVDLCADGKLDIFDLCLMKRALIAEN